MLPNDRYKDLESLLFKGFILYKIRIGGIHFVFKSVNDLEYEQLQVMSGIEGEPSYNINFHINYLYFSLYMIDGQNILEKRDDYYYDFFHLFKNFPSVLLTKFFSFFEHFVERLNKALNLIEPYSYEENSRYNWMSRINYQLNSPQITGIRGTDRLGLNQFQKYWSILNIREDQKERFESEYSLAKFLASFQDSKAMRRVENADKVRKEEEDKRRERVKAMGTPDEVKYISGPTETRDGIIAELEKQMTGVKDAHDFAIENYEKSLRFNMLQQMQEVKKVRDERNSTFRMIDEARPITPEEMAERMIKSKERAKAPLITREDSETRSKFLEMSHVTDSDVIKETGIMSEEDYKKIVNDDFIKQIRGTPEKSKPKSEEEYKKQQKKLAFQYGLDLDKEESLTFPDVRKK